MEPAPKREENFRGLFSQLPKFKIDPKGTFKYIQIECRGIATGQCKLIIRGRGWPVEHHKDIFEGFRNEAVLKGFCVVDTVRDDWDILQSFKIKYGEDRFSFRCIGGGRMVHTPQTKSLEVYGFSTKYSVDNRTDHQPAITVACRHLPYPKKNIFISKKFY